jgi:Zn-dependent peptidase ImmA (M78 family)
MGIRRNQIREAVEALLTKHRVKSGAVPIEEIARSLGATITLDDVDDDLSGFLYRETGGRKTIIGVNKSHHPNRRRFTIAHEIGHLVLHKGEMVHLDSGRAAFTIDMRDSESARGEDDDEREANLFAAELLMPAKFLTNDLENIDLDLLSDSTVLVNLAKKYKVSVQALTFRLANLGYINV